MISRVSTNTGATVQVHGMIYKAVTQSVLIYGSESWVVTGVMLKVLEVFHNRLDRHITGIMEKRVADGEWEYTPVVAAL